MSSVIRQAQIGTQPMVLGRAAAIDPALADAIARAEAAAYDRGFTEGMQAAEPALEATRARTLAAVETAVADGTGHIRQALSAGNAEVIGIAVEMAEMLVSRVPNELTEGLTARLEAALEQIDDEQIRIALNADDAAAIGHLLPHPTGIDPTLGRGEARIEGVWSRADLTLRQAWELIRQEYEDA